jgi:hypothetical protein
MDITMSTTRRHLLSTAAVSALFAGLSPTLVATEPTDEVIGIFVDLRHGESLADMKIFTVQQRADGSIVFTDPDLPERTEAT